MNEKLRIDMLGLDNNLEEAKFNDKMRVINAKKENLKNLKDFLDKDEEVEEGMYAAFDEAQQNILEKNETFNKKDAVGVEVISSFLKTGPSTIETDIAEIGKIEDTKVLTELESALHDYSVGDHLSEEQIRFIGAVSDRKRELLD